MAFLCLSFVACFITWKIFFSCNTAGKYLSLDLAISLFFFTLRARQRVLITEYTVFLMRKSKRILYRLHVQCTQYTCSVYFIPFHLCQLFLFLTFTQNSFLSHSFEDSFLFPIASLSTEFSLSHSFYNQFHFF